MDKFPPTRCQPFMLHCTQNSPSWAAIPAALQHKIPTRFAGVRAGWGTVLPGLIHMELLAHLLWAVVAARLAAGPAVPWRGALRLALVAVVVPELGELAQLWGPSVFLRWHRGPLHAPALLPGWVALAAVLGPRLGVSWGRAALLALVTRLGVMALMLLSAGGLPMAWPAQAARESVRWLAHQDPVPAVLMLGCLTLGHALGAVRAAAAWACAALGLYVGLMGGFHAVAVDRAERAAAREGVPPWSVRLFVTAQGPLGLQWNSVAADQDEALVRAVDVWGGLRPSTRVALGLEEPLVGEVRHDPVSAAWWAHASVPMAVSERRLDGRVEVFTRDLARRGRFEAVTAPAPYDAWIMADEDGHITDVLLHLPAPLAPLMPRHSFPAPRAR